MITVKAFAKFNLNLHILPEKLANGFSEIKAVNCRLSLADELSFEKQKEIIELAIINCHPEFISGSRYLCNKMLKQVQHDNFKISTKKNTVYQVAELLKKEARKTDLGARIKLVKNIPVKSGLGGGSADAAATLLSLNKLWELNYSLKKLSEIGGKIGSDILYCLKGERGEVGKTGGYGEKVEILSFPLPEIWGIIVSPNESKPSTKWAYDNLDRSIIGQNLWRMEKLVKAIKDKDKKEIIENLFNDFESLMIKKFPMVSKIKEDLKKAGALNSLMAGSGLSVTGFFENKLLAGKAKKLLGKKYKQSYLVKTI